MMPINPFSPDFTPGWTSVLPDFLNESTPLTPQNFEPAYATSEMPESLFNQRASPSEETSPDTNAQAIEELEAELIANSYWFEYYPSDPPEPNP